MRGNEGEGKWGSRWGRGSIRQRENLVLSGLGKGREDKLSNEDRELKIRRQQKEEGEDTHVQVRFSKHASEHTACK